MIKSIPPEEIKIGPRHRKDLGDIKSLADSIDSRGLLQPPVITTDNELVCGLRRLEAVKRLKWLRVDVRVIDPDDMLRAEFDENEIRKQFTPTERAAIARAIEERLEKRQGHRGGKRISTGEPVYHGTQVNGSLSVESGEKTRDVVAKAAGFNNFLARDRVDKVIANGAPVLVEAMDKEEVSIRAAADLADLPKAEQEAVVANGKHAATAKAAEIRKGKSRVNGVLADDPPEIAKARANGRIAHDVVPDVEIPADESEPEPEPAKPFEAELDDPTWLATLPVRAKLSPTRVRGFDADALDFRRSEPALKTFRHALSRALKGNGEWSYRVKRLLRTDHPKHWLICPAVENGGCGGSGEVPLIGQCPKCRGRGYYIR